MHKFPPSIYSGNPRRRPRPVYRKRSMLDDVRNARLQQQFDSVTDQVMKSALLYGVGIGFSHIETKKIFGSN